MESLEFEALGTRCHLLAVGVSSRRLVAGAAWVGHMHRRFTRFDPLSELSLFNRAAGGWTSVSPDLESLLRAALDAHRLSGALVHCGVLGSMLGIGYTRPLAQGPTLALLPRPGPLPALPEILEIRPGHARIASGAGIDLGGIAKGWMADRLCERLGPNSVANLGGDLFAVGPGPEGEGWPVGLGGSTLLLDGLGAATSSTRRRSWGSVHHLIDPRTGRPATTGLEQVSVLAPNGFMAEVVAKTALLLGADDAPAYLAANSQAWALN
jgi:thiamine biosynthesis lipoprotein